MTTTFNAGRLLRDIAPMEKALKPEIKQWLTEHGEEGRLYLKTEERPNSPGVALYVKIDIKDPTTALLFKLTWM